MCDVCETKPEEWAHYWLDSLLSEHFRVLPQIPVGKFRVDFLIPEVRLVVEVDGRSHATKLDADRRRDVFLRGLGYEVIHLDNLQATWRCYEGARWVLRAIRERLVDLAIEEPWRQNEELPVQQAWVRAEIETGFVLPPLAELKEGMFLGPGRVDKGPPLLLRQALQALEVMSEEALGERTEGTFSEAFGQAEAVMAAIRERLEAF